MCPTEVSILSVSQSTNQVSLFEVAAYPLNSLTRRSTAFFTEIALQPGLVGDTCFERNYERRKHKDEVGKDTDERRIYQLLV